MTAAAAPAPTPERTLLLAADTAAELAAILAQPDAVVLARAGGLKGDGPTGEGRCRLGIVGPTAKNLALARRVVGKGRPWRGRNDVWFSPEPLLADGGRIAFLFPGLEGEFAPNVTDVAAALDVEPPAIDIRSIGTHAAGALRVGRLLDGALRRMGVTPDLVAGHSVGEWNAMAAGGMFSAAELDELIGRCDLDSMAVPDVDFGVVGCPLERLGPVLAAHPEVVLSHENSTNQTVVCGPVDDVAAVLATMRGQGVVCQVLPFRSGFHTPLLRPHLSYFENGLAALPLRAQRVPVWSSTVAAPFPADAADVRALCVRHLLEPVRFRSTVAGLHAAGARVFVQVGAGQLGSLVSDTLRAEDHLTVAANSAHRSGLEQLARVAAAVWVEGGRPRFDAFTADAPPAAATANAPATATATATVHALPTRSPAAAELAALLDEIADLAQLATTTLTAPAVADVLPVSTSAMPYLLDHCFVPQRAGWPDDADRRPVVPATTIIEHLFDAASARAGGAAPLGLDALRLHRWLAATPAADVPIVTGPAGPGRLRVSLGEYADAEVVLDEARTPAPAPWAPEPGERRPRMRAAELYEQRWLFHGERFQVLRRSIAIGPRTARADLLVSDVPGALLDGVGHVLGQWLAEEHPGQWLAFPVGVERLRRHGELPPPGSLVQCTVRVRAVTAQAVEAEAQLTHEGRVLVSIEGWRDHVFDGELADNETYRFPESNTIARRRPDGRWLARERWHSLSSRELWLHRYLTGAELAAYRRCAPREQRGWLLGRIAVKDAVRDELWRRGAGPIFPAELTVHGPRDGWCTVTGTHGLAVPELAVALAHTNEVALAQLHHGAAGAGPALTVHDLPAAKELIR